MSDISHPEKGMDAMDDEIDLFDLIDDIKNQWKWLIGTGVVCVVVALAYALTAQPTFQTEMVYKPVKYAELLQLNQPRLKDVLGYSDAYLTPKQAFANVRSEALSSNTIREFYALLLEENDPQLMQLIYKPEITDEQNTIKFAERFTHVDPGAKETDPFLRIKLQLGDAKLAANLLNRFSDFVIEKNKAEVQQSVTLQIQAQLEQWQMQAEELRSKYFAKKSQRLIELKEAATIAKKINQQSPIYGSERFAIGSTPPLYMMGEKALRAEIEELNNRDDVKNEASYIQDLANVLWKIKTAEETNINWKKLAFVQQDQSAVIPLSPIKPKKTLIVAIGVVAGGMLGIMLAIMAAAWERRQQQKTQKI